MAYTGSTAAILSNYDEVLKRFYLPAIQEQLNHDTILSDRIDVNEKDVYGKEATINCHYGRSAGHGAAADGGSLPDADYQKYKTAQIPTKYIYGRITVSGPTIAATRSERGAYARAVDNEIRGIVRDLQHDVNRMLWGCGYGIVARLGGASVATADPYTVQKKYRGNTAGGDAFASAFGSRYIDDYAGAASAFKVVTVDFTGSAGAISATVDTTAMTIPLTGSISESSDGTYVTLGSTHTDPAPSPAEAAGAFLVRANGARSVDASSGAGYGRLEMMGLRGIVDEVDPDHIAFTDGTSSNTGFAAASAPTADGLQTLSTDSYTFWKAIVDHHESGRYAGQRSLTFKGMQKVLDAVEDNAGKDYGPDMVLTTKAIRREYLDLCETRRRTVNSMSLDGGWSALDYNGIPLTVDKDAIDGEMYFLTLKDLQIFRMSDYDWMQKDGAVLSRISGYDAYEAVLYRYAELGTTRRNAQGVMADLYYTD